jgi:hypothetical protein
MAIDIKTNEGLELAGLSFQCERLQMQKDVETVSHFMQAWMFPSSTVSLECC